MNTQQQFTLDDVHHPDFEAEVARRLTNDMEALIRRRSNFVSTEQCPACRSPQRHAAFNFQGMDYVRCDDCSLLFIDPAPTEADHLAWVVNSTSLQYWRDEMPTDTRERRLPMYRDRASYVINCCRVAGLDSATALEIGAGNGELLIELKSREDSPFARLIALEPQPMSDIPGVAIIQSGFEGVPDGLAVDVAMAFEVLEHILGPDDFLATVRSVLRPGGLLILSTPNAQSLEVATLGTASTNVSFDHVRFYNPRALELLLDRCGFDVVTIETPGKLDAEMIRAAYAVGRTQVDDPSLRFILDNCDLAAFQRFLVSERLSSHMRCVARAR